jgi:adenylate kinase
MDSMEKKERRVIIITGSPGVGKTSVSAVLASKLNAVHVDLGELVVKENLVIGKDEARDTLIADMERVSNRAKETIAQAEGDVVLDGHYAVDVVPAKHVSRVFVLRRNPEELKPLMEARGWSDLKLWENLACEVLDVCLSDAVKACGGEKVCEVDVTRRTTEDVAEEIVAVLAGKRKCFVGVIDWLTYLEMAGRLDEFLKKF